MKSLLSKMKLEFVRGSSALLMAMCGSGGRFQEENRRGGKKPPAA
jgi:hypothetical protein